MGPLKSRSPGYCNMGWHCAFTCLHVYCRHFAPCSVLSPSLRPDISLCTCVFPCSSIFLLLSSVTLLPRFFLLVTAYLQFLSSFSYFFFKSFPFYPHFFLTWFSFWFIYTFPFLICSFFLYLSIIFVCLLIYFYLFLHCRFQCFFFYIFLFLCDLLFQSLSFSLHFVLSFFLSFHSFSFSLHFNFPILFSCISDSSFLVLITLVKNKLFLM